MAEPNTPTRLFRRGSWAEDSRIAELLRQETVGGALLLVGTVIALVWANSPLAESYTTLREVTVGPAALHLDLSLETWASDGLLAVFFFVVGLELKREFVAGDLRDPRRAALPILAAVGGMVAPALIYVAINFRAGGDALGGWAIPTATDIAFALAVLAVISTHLPTGLRTFLLTLAVVDDLLAVAIIAVFYTSDLHLLALAGAMVPLGLFAFAVQRRVRAWWVLLPLAVATWVLMHESGVHATVAGVLLGFTVPVLARRRADGREQEGMAKDFEHRITPLSTGFAVPVFAFFAAGVTIGGLSGLTDSLGDTVALGITVGLVVGKFVGVLGTTYLVSRFTRADLDEDLSWIDVAGLAVLAGIGFTVSLLIGDLSFPEGSAREEHVKVGVLAGSLVSALLATVMLRSRNRVYRRIEQEESADADADGIPDVYQRDV
jgi:NhaA family Na+:H+ antiporter